MVTKLKNLLTTPPPKPTIEFRTRLFNATSLSMLLCLMVAGHGFQRKLWRKNWMCMRECSTEPCRELDKKMQIQYTRNSTDWPNNVQSGWPTASDIWSSQATVFAWKRTNKPPSYPLYHLEVSDKNKRGAPQLTFRDKIWSYIDEYSKSQKARNQIALHRVKSSQLLTRVVREEDQKWSSASPRKENCGNIL